MFFIKKDASSVSLSTMEAGVTKLQGTSQSGKDYSTFLASNWEMAFFYLFGMTIMLTCSIISTPTPTPPPKNSMGLDEVQQKHANYSFF